MSGRISSRSGSPRPCQRGVVLIEALIAILIFSLGVLGLVGLQASLTRATTSAKYRADAAYLAQDIIGTMWADSANLTQYKYGNCAGYALCRALSQKVADTLPSGNLEDLTVCTAADTASPCTDTIVTGATANGRVLITLAWTVPGEGTHRFKTSSSINP
jgi:type IV pilus assembly protein PilV